MIKNYSSSNLIQRERQMRGKTERWKICIIILTVVNKLMNTQFLNQDGIIPDKKNTYFPTVCQEQIPDVRQIPYH